MVELTALGTAALAGGDDFFFVEDAGTQTDYLPEEDMRHYLERFSEAVARSKHWRS